MSYEVRYKNSLKGDLKKLKAAGLAAKFLDIVATLEKNPYERRDGFEKLQPQSDNLYSRRINIRHRVVYEIRERDKTVDIYSAWSH
jgi:Txe/YoeB family toxin of toxin-antitoxin system